MAASNCHAADDHHHDTADANGVERYVAEVDTELDERTALRVEGSLFCGKC